MTTNKKIYSNTVSYTQLYNIKSHQMQIYNMLYNAIVTYVDLTLKIHSTFINETVKVLQIQLTEHSSNTIKFSISKKILMHFADLNYLKEPAVKLFHNAA